MQPFKPVATYMTTAGNREVTKDNFTDHHPSKLNQCQDMLICLCNLMCSGVGKIHVLKQCRRLAHLTHPASAELTLRRSCSPAPGWHGTCVVPLCPYLQTKVFTMLITTIHSARLGQPEPFGRSSLPGLMPPHKSYPALAEGAQHE